jgi:hypothetical protein
MTTKYVHWVRRGLSFEAFKFAVYLGVPIGFVIWYADPRRVRHYLEKVGCYRCSAHSCLISRTITQTDTARLLACCTTP